ncbi:aspartate kinase [Porticoccaceae bacterium]|nr:aspartate kinase [Porticoccaceae bacterium]MDB2344208.1 aspartate kinase [Porticoccaceae bacterium]MDB2634913.1 aspartate kinase [Porticoccaceae bacterium]MDB2663820.1 aspartate kinase [Porticoccaceae bacterium]
MGLIVKKYGGTSVGSIERIQAVAEKVHASALEGNQIVVVVSAMSGETNRLLGLAAEIDADASPREMDVILSTGEQVTIALLAMALQKLGSAAVSYTGGQVAIQTDNAYSKARIKNINSGRIKSDLAEGSIVVVAGFQGVDDRGSITTLGRGGSDTTAVALAAALQADECQIYTDVDGVYTTDPRVVSDARKLDKITFEEMLEMASQGSKILQIRSVEFAGKYNVPLRVLSSFDDGQGTLISLQEDSQMESPLVSGIAFNKDEAKLTIRGIPDQPGVAYKVLGAISNANIEIDVIVQNVAKDNSASITFTVNKTELSAAEALLRKIAEDLGALEVDADKNIAKVSIVGVGMRSHAGVAATMFEALSDEGINIQLITTSEIKITVVIDERYLELAVRALHSAFELGDDDQLKD